MFLVQKVQSQKLYALKVMKKRFVIHSNLVRYALTERNVLKNIRHPFIIRLKYSF